MNTTEVTIVRAYLEESSGLLRPILQYLRDEVRVKGVTVFRGISGFGSSGKMHEASLLDLSLDLPVVVEYFDEPVRVAATIERLHELVGAGHVVSWSARMNARG